ncbi:MAG: SUMF1/EgtB/PvdO family nonheme iron enzyme [Labilithrix sp.]|nr:SUMF1/EgtB/PvdO family nonheme iron enzyme [Labilithrix sp.]
MLSATPLKLTSFALAALVLVGACTTGADDPAATPPVIGDPNPDGKPPGESCATGDDCRTGVCTGGTCQTATNTDGVRNGDETDVDCGGSGGPPCDAGKSCLADGDCAGGVCVDFTCGGATGAGCGGAGALPRCADGEPCAAGADCASGVCVGGACRPPGPSDGVKNGGETDVDCGGAHPDPCADGKGCLTGDDCESRVCAGATKTCSAPTYDDKVKNGAETDVDCGGPGAPKKCAAGLTCVDHGDCASDGCGYDKKCAMGASCTQLEGGQTCGPNEGLAKQADCCSRAKVGAYEIDKYLVTAGRMRAFLTRHDGKVRDWAATLPANTWNQAWTASLPNSVDGAPGDGNNANTQLGPYYGKRSCETGYHTGHTFWTPPEYGDTKDFPRNVLDTKALNCVPWWLLAALCVFDGGHLLTEAELRAAYTNGGTTAYPWGARGTYTTGAQNAYAVGYYSYATPNPPPNAAFDVNGYKDVAFYVAPPGRRPAGNNATGHADLVGNLLEWVGDSERQFVWNGSFERHSREADTIQAPIDEDPYMARDPRPGRDNRPWTWPDVVAGAPDSGNVNGYYAIGGRCGY